MNDPYSSILAALTCEAPEWHQRAMCRGGDYRRWETENLPRIGQAKVAEKRCAGCPVVRECAEFFLDHPDTTGVVVAGIAVAAASYTPVEAIRALSVIAGREPPEIVTELTTTRCAGEKCTAEIAPRDAWITAGRPAHVRPIGGHRMCQQCYQRQRYATKHERGPQPHRRRLAVAV